MNSFRVTPQWSTIGDLAGQLVAYAEPGDEALYARIKQKICRSCDELLLQFPLSVDVLATKAEYSGNSRTAELLFLKAHAIAKFLDDQANAVLVASSLCDLYLSKAEDQLCLLWAEELERALAVSPDEDERAHLESVKQELAKRGEGRSHTSQKS